MEIVTCIAMGIATFAAIMAICTMVRVQKLEGLVDKHRTETLDLMHRQCDINQKQQDVDEITRRRLDQTGALLVTAMGEIEKLKKEDK